MWARVVGPDFLNSFGGYMRLLTNFWMKTPVGKLEFSRKGLWTWEMSGTKGVEARRLTLRPVNPSPRQVAAAFGWPENPEAFRPYGMVHEEVPPRLTDHGSAEGVRTDSGVRKGVTIVTVSAEGTIETFIRQKEGIRPDPTTERVASRKPGIRWPTAQSLNEDLKRLEGDLANRNRRRGDKPKPKIEPILTLHGLGSLPGLPIKGVVWVLKGVRDTMVFTSKEDLEAYCAQQKETI